MLVAIDPGFKESGWVCMHEGKVQRAEVITNEYALAWLRRLEPRAEVVIEAMSGYGQTIGLEVMETIHWAGRFHEAAEHFLRRPVGRLFRRDIKLHLCGNCLAKDPDIWLAVCDRYGGPTKAVGLKATPGPLYGVRSHCRAAVALALAWQDGCRSQQLADVAH